MLVFKFLAFLHICFFFWYFYHLSYDDVGKYFCVHMFKCVRTYVNHVKNICHLELTNPLTKHTLLVIG